MSATQCAVAIKTFVWTTWFMQRTKSRLNSLLEELQNRRILFMQLRQLRIKSLKIQNYKKVH